LIIRYSAAINKKEKDFEQYGKRDICILQLSIVFYAVKQNLPFL